MIIYGLWGITSLLTFWPSLMKIIRTLASKQELMGSLKGGRGVVSTIHLAIATAIFGYFQTKALASKGIEMIIIFYSLAL
ncbi:hypothetical protein OT407_02155 [Campylobacter jejuni]|nr:hypothetical protein [Campylobacter jejuni]MDV6197817.1 hypothetical protein [Campylobacter jejuni]